MAERMRMNRTPRLSIGTEGGKKRGRRGKGGWEGGEEWKVREGQWGLSRAGAETGSGAEGGRCR